MNRPHPYEMNTFAHPNDSALTQEELLRTVSYDAETGVFTWNVSKGGRACRVGARAGRTNDQGYVLIAINQREYRAHRLAWFYVYGMWPDVIDHINGVRNDNRIVNLRAVSRSMNQQNQRAAPLSNKSSGLLGVSRGDPGRWRAHIKIKGKQKWLGQFGTPEEAHAAYLKAKRELHAGCTI